VLHKTLDVLQRGRVVTHEERDDQGRRFWGLKGGKNKFRLLNLVKLRV
jgi:hypothetical protein